MYKNLCAGAVGIRVTTVELAALAEKFRFGGIDLDVSEAAELLDGGREGLLKTIFERHGIKAGGFGLPVEFRKDEDAFQADLKKLPRLAKAAAGMDCRRCPTWILPASDELPFDENFELHRRRLKACAEVLAAHGIGLGLEFVGPRTMRAGKAHEFIWNMSGMLELAEAIGTGNVGLLLDCWHWYTSEGTAEDILALKPEQVVYVHVSDAPAGIPVDRQIDNKRAMPGATGVIDIAAFLKALSEIGYDGPITAEPFNPELKAMSAEDAADVVGGALDRIFARAGIHRE